MKKHLKLSINGDVKHSGVRFSIMQKAYQLGICGFAAYEDNGKTLIVHAEGNSLPLKNFMEYCKRGLLELTIDQIHEQELAVENFSSFDLRA